MTTITVSKEKIKKQGGVVILPLGEYQKLCERAVPAYYLKGKEAEELDKLVETGLKEYRQGKCKTIKSLADLD
ncbi:hypothetical protein KKB71_00890 [Patescibacteria group bacterium]|nr:hypothetical protein [Patescibacteria group bacterium]MBU2219374.1 hypothetical protein [Patescibacteria group bacterium]MBU2263693.1 hypothetical protein [Patescibacteria group bacterium]